MIAITDRKEYKANASIKIISDKEADKIIETREPRGLFVYVKNGLIVRCDNRTEILCEVGAKTIGIDNRTGDAWTEEFDTYEDCVDWLLDPNREAHEEAEPMHYNYPRVKFVDSSELYEQLGHIESELGEIERATSKHEHIMEIFDLQHSVETAIRILQEKHGVDVESYRQAVIEKNRRRGYYGEEE